MFSDVLKLCICVENDFSSKIRDFSSFGFDFTDMLLFFSTRVYPLLFRACNKDQVTILNCGF